MKTSQNKNLRNFWLSHPYLYFIVFTNLLVILWLLLPLPFCPEKSPSSYSTLYTVIFMYAIGYPASFAFFEYRKKRARLKGEKSEEAIKA